MEVVVWGWAFNKGVMILLRPISGLVGILEMLYIQIVQCRYSFKYNLALYLQYVRVGKVQWIINDVVTVGIKLRIKIFSGKNIYTERTF